MRAYLLKEALRLLWGYMHPARAAHFLERWCTKTMRSRIEPLKRTARTCRRHRPLILNWFRARGTISAAAVEGLNHTLKPTLRKAHGYRSLKVVEIACHHTLGRLPEPEFAHRFF